MLLCSITLSSSRENQRCAQEVARRISGALAGEVYTKSSQDLISRQRAISGAVAGESTHKSRHTKYPSQTLIPRITLFSICLSFSSPHFTLAVLFALSLSVLPLFLYLPLFACFLFACVSDCLLGTMALSRFGDIHLKRLEEIESNARSFMVLQFEHNNFFRNELKEQKSFMSFMNKEL